MGTANIMQWRHKCKWHVEFTIRHTQQAAKCYSSSLRVSFRESKVINYKLTTASSHRSNAKALKVLPRGTTSWHVTGCTALVKPLEQWGWKNVATKYRLFTAWIPHPPLATLLTHSSVILRWQQVDQKTFNLWVYNCETCWTASKIQI